LTAAAADLTLFFFQVKRIKRRKKEDARKNLKLGVYAKAKLRMIAQVDAKKNHFNRELLAPMAEQS